MTGNNFWGWVLVQIWITKADPRVERGLLKLGPHPGAVWLPKGSKTMSRDIFNSHDRVASRG